MCLASGCFTDTEHVSGYGNFAQQHLAAPSAALQPIITILYKIQNTVVHVRQSATEIPSQHENNS